jgi:hypothetical protein
MRIWSSVTCSLLLMAAGSTFADSSNPPAVQLPIRSPDALQRYLDSPQGQQSPLMALSPGARKRFIGTLMWGTKGVGSFEEADLQELNDAQILQVLTLLGQQDLAAGVHGVPGPGPSPGQSQPESPLELQFDRLYLEASDPAKTPDQTQAIIRRDYDMSLAKWQHADQLKSVSPHDLALLFRAAGEAQFYVATDAHLQDMRLDLNELDQRGMAQPEQVQSLYQQLITLRRFDQAHQLAQHYPQASLDEPPPFIDQSVAMMKHAPTMLLINQDGTSMQRVAVDMHAHTRIVVIAGCHFSADAAKAIQADPSLAKLFKAHAIWLADSSESLQDVKAWNREHPDQSIGVAWSNTEWNMVDTRRIPTFYIFRDGKLVTQWAGWDANTGMQTLRANLAKAGVLSS